MAYNLAEIRKIHLTTRMAPVWYYGEISHWEFLVRPTINDDVEEDLPEDGIGFTFHGTAEGAPLLYMYRIYDSTLAMTLKLKYC